MKVQGYGGLLDTVLAKARTAIDTTVKAKQDVTSTAQAVQNIGTESIRQTQTAASDPIGTALRVFNVSGTQAAPASGDPSTPTGIFKGVPDSYLIAGVVGVLALGAAAWWATRDTKPKALSGYRRRKSRRRRRK